MSMFKKRGRIIAGSIESGTHGYIRKQTWTAPDAAANDACYSATACSSGETLSISTGFTNPDMARTVRVVIAGTATHVKAVAAALTGTDIEDTAITETLATFTANTLQTKTSTKAFKTVTALSVPAMDGNGCTVSVGIAAGLGLDRKVLGGPNPVGAWQGTTGEATAAVLTIGTNTDVAKCYITFNTAPDAAKNFGAAYWTEDVR